MEWGIVSGCLMCFTTTLASFTPWGACFFPLGFLLLYTNFRIVILLENSIVSQLDLRKNVWFNLRSDILRYNSIHASFHIFVICR